jgi:hypothetical protein
LEELQALVTQRLTEMTKDVIDSLTGKASILEALSVARLQRIGIAIISPGRKTLQKRSRFTT